MILKRFSLLLCFLAIFNCSSNNNKIDNLLTDNQETADLMYIDAMNKFNSKQLDEAIIIFEEIERLYPLSNEAIQSQIMSGFIDYGNLDYNDAIYKFSRIINKYPSLKNIDSRVLLKQVSNIIKESNFLVGNVDITILAEEPKLAKHIPIMKKNLADDLNSKTSLINIKATTTEGMGFIGRGEGISAHAVVLLNFDV